MNKERMLNAEMTYELLNDFQNELLTMDEVEELINLLYS